MYHACSNLIVRNDMLAFIVDHTIPEKSEGMIEIGRGEGGEGRRGGGAGGGERERESVGCARTGCARSCS
jgi:hypothetical protein